MTSFEQIFYYFMGFLPFLLVFFLWTQLRKNFFDWREDLFYVKQNKILLEIRIPKEITRTPLAMELVFQALFNPSREWNWLSKKYRGRRRPRFSIEIASHGGNVRFYIFLEERYRKTVEAAFYSQYPSVELVEVPDYTKFVSFDPKTEYLKGAEYGLAKADPFPIKTYDKFGLDKPGIKPEEIQDPMSITLETMGSIDPEDHLWLQIIFKAQVKDNEIPLSLMEKIKHRIEKGSWEKKVDWSKEAKEIIEELREQDKPKEGEIIKFNLMSKQESGLIDDILNNIAKPSFWVTIRAIYKTSNKGNKNKHGGALDNFFHNIGTNDANSIRKMFDTSFTYPWDDFDGKRVTKLKIDAFGDYKRRKMSSEVRRYFTWGAYEKAKYKQYRLSTAELATIFHLPFSTVSPPTLERSRFKKAEAPIDLPT